MSPKCEKILAIYLAFQAILPLSASEKDLWQGKPVQSCNAILLALVELDASETWESRPEPTPQALAAIKRFNGLKHSIPPWNKTTGKKEAFYEFFIDSRNADAEDYAIFAAHLSYLEKSAFKPFLEKKGDQKSHASNAPYFIARTFHGDAAIQDFFDKTKRHFESMEDFLTKRSPKNASSKIAKRLSKLKKYEFIHDPLAASTLLIGMNLQYIIGTAVAMQSESALISTSIPIINTFFTIFLNLRVFFPLMKESLQIQKTKNKIQHPNLSLLYRNMGAQAQTQQTPVFYYDSWAWETRNIERYIYALLIKKGLNFQNAPEFFQELWLSGMEDRLHWPDNNPDEVPLSTMNIFFQRLLETDANGEPVLTLMLHFSPSAAEDSSSDIRRPKKKKEKRSTRKGLTWDILQPLPAPATN